MISNFSMIYTDLRVLALRTMIRFWGVTGGGGTSSGIMTGLASLHKRSKA